LANAIFGPDIPTSNQCTGTERSPHYQDISGAKGNEVPIIAHPRVANGH
jgi:hypothetical protein